MVHIILIYSFAGALSRTYPEENSAYYTCNPQWCGHVRGYLGGLSALWSALWDFTHRHYIALINSKVVRLEICWILILQYLMKFLPSALEPVGMKTCLTACIWCSLLPCSSQHEQSWQKGCLVKVWVRQIERQGCICKSQKKPKHLVTQQWGH